LRGRRGREKRASTYGYLVVVRGAWAVGCALLVVLGSALTVVVLVRGGGLPVLHVALTPLPGWSFGIVGLLACLRTRWRRVGVLLLAVGLAWFVHLLDWAHVPALTAVGAPLRNAHAAVFAHLLLAFPSGRLGSPAMRALAAAGYLDAVGLQTIAAVAGPRPRSDGAFWYDFEAAVGIVLAGLVLAVLARRARRDAPRPSGAVWVAAMLAFAALLANVLAGWVATGLTLPFWVLFSAAFAAVPFAFLGSLLGLRLRRAGVARLLVQLPRAGDVAGLRDALADALGDPSLQLAFWLPAGQRFGVPAGQASLVAGQGSGASGRASGEPGRVSGVADHDSGAPSRVYGVADPPFGGAGQAFAVADEGGHVGSARGGCVVPDRGGYVDAQGRELRLPGPGEARTATPVMRDGRRIGALVHEGGPRHDPELVTAVASAAAIALDNARLQAELRARLAELQASRARLVEAAATERRRIERNLHDGAQQRLVSVAFALGLARSRLPTDPAAAGSVLAEAQTGLSAALDELRRLSQGIHPGVLAERGLRAAIGELTWAAPMPVHLHWDAPDELPESVQEAGYYVVAEALANTAKHAHATTTHIRVSRRGDLLTIEISDDGRGGAGAGDGSRGPADQVETPGGQIDDDSRGDAGSGAGGGLHGPAARAGTPGGEAGRGGRGGAGAGTGLRGLADRVEALGGVLTVHSLPGAGTTIRAVLPCG
jgi:signal transduction histidine kinase